MMLQILSYSLLFGINPAWTQIWQILQGVKDQKKVLILFDREFHGDFNASYRIWKSCPVLETFTIKDGRNDQFKGQNRPENGSFWLINPKIFHLMV